MKSKLDTDTTAAQKYRQFEGGLRHVLTVSKTELAEREKAITRLQRASRPKRGPKPSGHASHDKD